jgi:hypothetical protein
MLEIPFVTAAVIAAPLLPPAVGSLSEPMKRTELKFFLHLQGRFGDFPDRRLI